MTQDKIISCFANDLCMRIAGEVVQELKKQGGHVFYTNGECPRNPWDEFCVQHYVYLEPAWDNIKDYVSSYVLHHVEGLAQHQQLAIWLQTEPGFDWFESEETEPFANERDIVRHIVDDYIIRLAEKRVEEDEEIAAEIDRMGES